jgi:hypothetical protein
MIRLLVMVALGYVAYRIIQETIASVPDEFEPLPVLPKDPEPGAMEDHKGRRRRPRRDVR